MGNRVRDALKFGELFSDGDNAEPSLIRLRITKV